jgi:hypothetical protein
MIWHNEWVWHNLDERLINKESNFKFGLSPRKFKNLNFKEASEYTANQIYEKYKNVYVALSGGMDSLYVTKIFHEYKIPFTPVIVISESNIKEVEYAINYCNHNHINPHTIYKTNKELIEYYMKNIYSRMFSVGVNSTASFIVQEYAKENNGIMVSGDYLIDIENDTITCSDYDFYRDALIGQNINFYYYNEEIAYSMTKETSSPFSETKYKLYGFSNNRSKMYYEYESHLIKFIRMINKNVDKTKYEYTLTSKKEFMNFMERYIV